MSVDMSELLSQCKFFDSYSRYIKDKSRFESWEESIDRVMQMHRSFYSDKLDSLDKYLKQVEFDYKQKLFLGSQRALQFGGKQLLKHHMKLYNCVSSYCDRPEFFGEYFYVMLCGCGVGLSLQKHHIEKLPAIKKRMGKAKTHVIADSIEGWATTVDVLLSSYFVGGGKYPTYEGNKIFFDISNIRAKGEYISGGFKAPGPEGLRLALDKIEYMLQGLVINSSDPVKLQSIQIYDICMFIADAVLSGGVRRSATIVLFSPDDDQMIKAKTGNWINDESKKQRARSNNSALIVRNTIDKKEFNHIFKNIREYGEPGFYFSGSTEWIPNPCVEISMIPSYEGKSGWQGCNLTEINGNMCTNEEIFYRACESASILGTIQAGYTDFKFLDDVSKKIFDREALLGVSITGFMNNPRILFDEKVLKRGAKIVRETNKKIAKIIGINAAARATCVKPSGNISVLLKSASGIHPEHSKKYIRNVQLNKESSVTKLIQKNNQHMLEESAYSVQNTDFVASFIITPKRESMFKESMNGITHLEKVKHVQKNWVNEGTNKDLCVEKGITHNVSNTIIVKDDDWDSVEEYIFDNQNFFTGISLISSMGDKIFYQAPFVEVLTAKEIVGKYSEGSLAASSLIVDGIRTFENLWTALSSIQEYTKPDDSVSPSDFTKYQWVQRFIRFTDKYYSGNTRRAEFCLKDVFINYKANKIESYTKLIDWNDLEGQKEDIDVDTLGAQACTNGACDIVF